MKTITMISCLILLSCLPEFTRAQPTIMELANQPVLSPLIAISVDYKADTNQLFIDLKFTKMPKDLQPVDIYVFAKRYCRVSSAKDLTQKDQQSSKPSVNLAFPVYTHIDSAKLFSSNDLVKSISLTNEKKALFRNININQLVAENKIGFISLPFDLRDKCYLKGIFVVYLAMVHPDTETIVAVTSDIVKIQFNPGHTPASDPCDLDQNGRIDKWELEYCQIENIFGDANQDGIVDQWENDHCPHRSVLPKDRN